MLHTHHATRPPLHAGISLLLALLAPATSFAQTAPATVIPPKSVLTKEQAIDLALTHNQSMRASRLTIAQSQAGEVTAALKPNPVFTSTNSDFPVFAPGQLTFSNASNNQTFTQALTYLFERGGKRERRIQVARDTTAVTARTVDDTERQLRFQVGQAFVNVLLAKANLEAARADLRDFEQTVDLSKRRVASGDLAEADYLKIALQQLQFEQDESAAAIALVQGKAALRQLLGYDAVREDYDVAGTLEHRKATVTLDALQQQALAARPDLQAAGASTKLAASAVALARSNRALDITGEVEYDRNGPVNGVGFGLSLPIPIHDRNQGEIARSQVALSQASESEAAARVAVLTDVANAYAAFESNEKVVSLYESGYLAQAQQSRDISRYAFTKGATGLLDLLDAERTYRATQLAYRQALAAHLTSIEQLNFAVGTQVIP